MGTLSYSSNNSGGDWWLTDANWKALEDAGWKVDWFKDEESGKQWVDKDGRWLGALASSATLETDDFEQGVYDWESITGQRAADEGCNCCGSPHSFSFEATDGTWHYFEIERTSRGNWY